MAFGKGSGKGPSGGSLGTLWVSHDIGNTRESKLCFIVDSLLVIKLPILKVCNKRNVF